MNNKLLKPKPRTATKILAAALLLPVLSSAPATHALETDTKKELSTTGSILIGAFAGGPVGAALGVLTGILVSEKIDADDKLETAETEMQKAISQIALLEREITHMESSLATMQNEATELEQNLLTRLEFQMLFRTGDDKLTEFDRERVTMLVEYLNRNPELMVHLDGHADQRGTDEYNNLLAKYRAQSVADALMARGIPEERIQTQSHGSSLASSANGDYEGYALDRRVNIEVFNPQNAQEVVTLN